MGASLGARHTTTTRAHHHHHPWGHPWGRGTPPPPPPPGHTTTTTIHGGILGGAAHHHHHDPGTSQNCPKLLSGPNEKMPLNSRTCQPDRCREGGPRQGAKGKDRDARGRQGGMNRGGRERVPPQRLKCCREWSSGTLAEQKMLTLVRQGQ